MGSPSPYLQSIELKAASKEAHDRGNHDVGAELSYAALKADEQEWEEFHERQRSGGRRRER